MVFEGPLDGNDHRLGCTDGQEPESARKRNRRAHAAKRSCTLNLTNRVLVAVAILAAFTPGCGSDDSNGSNTGEPDSGAHPADGGGGQGGDSDDSSSVDTGAEASDAAADQGVDGIPAALAHIAVGDNFGCVL